MTPLQILGMYPGITVTAQPGGTVALHDPQHRPALAEYVRAREQQLYKELLAAKARQKRE